MNITAVYKFVKTPEGFRAVRQGDLQIYGFGLVPGTKRSFRQQSIYTALQAKFGKIFSPDIKLQGFKLQRQVGRGRAARAAGNHRPGRVAGGRLLPRQIRRRGSGEQLGPAAGNTIPVGRIANPSYSVPPMANDFLRRALVPAVSVYAPVSAAACFSFCDSSSFSDRWMRAFSVSALGDLGAASSAFRR